MPIREYKCERCGEISEYIVKYISSQSSHQLCKHCKEGNARLIQWSRPSPPKFNGKGFYETDYKEKNAD